MEVRCPHCHSPIELAGDSPLSAITCPCCGSSFSLLGEEETATYEAEAARALGHFTLVRQIGTGSFGSVWRANDTELDRTVAVKIPRKGQLDPSEAEQFLREARAAAQLRHPNIVSVYEVGREGDTVFIVSEYVEGVTLAEWLTAKRSSAREAAKWCATVADALHHAHEAGVVHRDLKPGNIILDDRGEPHITDFGLARREAGEVTMTVEGRVLGTPAYMSPEQAKGESHQADRRSDVYSLGVILFELLTGERPFRGSARMLLHQIIHDDAPSPRRLAGNVPRDLETVCLKCLEKEFGRRYPDAQQVAEDLRRFLNQEPIQARPVTRIERAWRWCKRKPLVAGLTAAVAIVLIAGAAVSSYFAVVANERAQVANEKTAEALREQQRASEEAERNRRLLYVSDMHLAGRAWDANDLQTVERLLKRHTPKNTEGDLRGFEWYYLWRLWWRNKQLTAATVLPERAVRIAVSPDGRRLAAASPYGKLVTLWDIPTRKKISEFGAADPLMRYRSDNFVVFAPGGNTLAYPNQDFTTLVLRNLDTAQESVLEIQDGAKFTAAAFSPRQNVVAASTDDGRVRIWDLATKSVSLELDKHRAPLRSIAISPDGQLVVSGGQDGTVLVWDATSAKRKATLRGQTGNTYAVVFSPDGKQIASASADRSVMVWDAESGRLLKSLQSFRDEARSVAFSPDGSLLAAGDRDGAVRIWDTRMFTELEPLRGCASLMALSFLPDGRLAFGTQDDGVSLCAIRLRTQDSLSAGASYVEQLELAPCGDSLILAAPADRSVAVVVPGASRVVSFAQVRLWRVGDDDLRELPPIDPAWRIGCIALSSRGILAIGEHDGRRVCLFDPLRGRQIESLVTSTATGATRAAFSADGRRLAVAFADGSTVFWQLMNGRIVRAQGVTTAAKHASPVGCLGFNHDGTVLVTGGSDRTVIAWDPDSGELLHRFGPGDSEVTSVAFSPDGDKIAVGSYVLRFRGEVEVWDWPSGNRACDLLGHRMTVWSLAFLKDRRTLISAGGDRVLKIWDLPTRQERFNLEGYASIFHSLAVSPDERLIAAGTRDGTIRLYRAATEEEVRAAGW